MSNKISKIFYKVTLGLLRKIYFSIREIYKYLIINHFVSLYTDYQVNLISQVILLEILLTTYLMKQKNLIQKK